MKRISLLHPVLILISLCGPVAWAVEPAVDPRLSLHLRDAKGTDGEVRAAVYMEAEPGAAERDALAKAGVRLIPGAWVPAVPGHHDMGFNLARVDASANPAALGALGVRRLAFTGNVLRQSNDVARDLMRVQQVHEGARVPAMKGAGVGIAVADSGFDLTHPDFPTPVESFDVTTGLTAAQWSTNVAPTSSSHGTHVAGSAIGRGTLSGGRYAGSAPEAGFHAYKIDTPPNASASDEAVIMAVMRAVDSGAKVFSLSYGGYSTYLDGSEAMEQAIDYADMQGVVSCISAGNNRQARDHYSVVVAPGESSTEFVYQMGNSTTSPFTGRSQLNVVWRDGSPGDYNIRVVCTNLLTGEQVISDETINYVGTSPRGTEARLVEIQHNLPPNSAWSYLLQVQNVATSGASPRVHVYAVSDRRGTFTSGDSSYTINAPATADRALAVAAWVHRGNWTDWTGALRSYSQFVGGVANFSSIGPRIDGAQKPNIAAPGSAMISIRSSVFANGTSLSIDNDGLNVDGSGPANYYVMQGTSMAAPHVAGVAALARQAAPTTTAARIRQAIETTASLHPDPTAQAGYGLVNAEAAVEDLITLGIEGWMLLE